MYITAGQLVAHAIGDYVIQSDWMAMDKTKNKLVALLHALTYALPFLFFTQYWKPLVFIVLTHYIIDHWRLARYICYWKNQLAPRQHRYPWANATKTGYLDDKPPWLAFWLLIITDNIMHVICNAFALYHWSS